MRRRVVAVLAKLAAVACWTAVPLLLSAEPAEAACGGLTYTQRQQDPRADEGGELAEILEDLSDPGCHSSAPWVGATGLGGAAGLGWAGWALYNYWAGGRPSAMAIPAPPQPRVPGASPLVPPGQPLGGAASLPMPSSVPGQPWGGGVSPPVPSSVPGQPWGAGVSPLVPPGQPLGGAASPPMPPPPASQPRVPGASPLVPPGLPLGGGVSPPVPPAQPLGGAASPPMPPPPASQPAQPSQQPPPTSQQPHHQQQPQPQQGPSQQPQHQQQAHQQHQTPQHQTPQHQPQSPSGPSHSDIRQQLQIPTEGLLPPHPDDQQALQDAVPQDQNGNPERFPDPREPWQSLQNDGGVNVVGRSNNCADCTRSFMETWYGNPQVSAPRTPDPDANGNPDRWSGEKDGTRNIEEVSNGSFGYAGPGTQGYDEVANQLRAAGPGSHSSVLVSWPNGGAHVFNAVNHNGTVLWVDTQSNTVSDKPINTQASQVWNLTSDADRNWVDPNAPSKQSQQPQNQQNQNQQAQNQQNQNQQNQSAQTTQSQSQSPTNPPGPASPAADSPSPRNETDVPRATTADRPTAPNFPPETGGPEDGTFP